MVTYMKVSRFVLRIDLRLIFRRKSQRYHSGPRERRSDFDVMIEEHSNLKYRLVVNSPSMSGIFSPLPTRTSSGPGVPPGALFRLSNRKRNLRAQTSMLEPSVTIAKRSKPSLSVCAKMCSMSWTNPSSQRPNQESRKCSIIRCMWHDRVDLGFFDISDGN